MNWIISAFNLCSAAFIPFWGQLADIFGRTAAMEMALVVMIIGSALCTAAPLSAFPMLILGRALQGISEAGIIVISRTILADKVSLKENAKNSSVFAFFAGISYAVGPVIGGFLTSTSWRWCFGINLPVAVAGGLIVMVLLRPVLLGPQPLPENLQQTRGVKNSTIQRFIVRMSVIDYGGQFLFLFGMGLIILALTWGGASYGWGTVQVMLPLILGTILTGAFVSWEYWMAPGNYLAQRFPLQKPTIPWELLVQRNMALLFYINFATGMGMCFPHTALRYTANSALAMTAVLYFVDIYFTLVKAYTASQAGMQLLYYTPGIGIGVCMAMFMCNVWPKQTFAPLFLGSVIEATGISVLAWALNKSHIPTIYGMMGLTGAGTGLRLMPGSLHGIGFFPNDIASVIALTAFAVPFGGTLAMTIMDAVFNNKAGFGLDSAPPASSSGTSSSNFIQYISELPPDIEAMVRNSAKKGIIWSFIAILPFMWLCVVSASFLGNVRITKKRKTDEQGRTDFSENVTESSFLLSFFRRRPEDTSASLEAVVVEIPNREKVAVHV
jgi:MFS family permease